MVSNDYKTPDIPADLVKCIQRNPKAGASADDYVANLSLTLEERNKCTKRLLAWYKEIQKASKKAAVTTAPKKLTP